MIYSVTYYREEYSGLEVSYEEPGTGLLHNGC